MLRILFGALALLMLLCTTSCFKGEGLAPFNPPVAIRIDATVPSLVYTNNLPVELDARRTLTINGPRALTFLWTCESFSSGIKPMIKKPQDAFISVDSLAAGIYIFQLTVSDLQGYASSSRFSMEVKKDTLKESPRLVPLLDRTIYLPQDSIILSAASAYSINPDNRKLTFLWDIIQQPSGSKEVELINDQPICLVTGLKEGFYRLGLSVTNEIGLSRSDTMELNVIKDSLAGTTRVYENLHWEKIQDYFFYVRLTIYEPDIFKFRNYSNLEVRLWDDVNSEWFSPLEYSFWSIQNNILKIQFDSTDDPYETRVAKVQIRFL